MNLPTFVSTQQVRNPDWKPEYNISGFATNMSDYNQKVEVEAEILTVNLNARSMRIRFQWMGKIETRDVPMPSNMVVTVSYT